ncbi:hypothetical protein GCM10027160_11420 [Streptomyces calidiresistens]|uniref:UspA domain-containing protein n=1 Tax=Streptomyces calidiresistens TaxID=1485586 RepID=A0A7W3T3I1_9ACTN|nr:universal stress protein [Streptomyces calidiresistens]MBB0230279.1 hypothetical protein [Streptomyces calidiresistens]
MDGPLFSVIAVALWVVTGLVGTALMARLGYRHPLWLLWGVLLGPFAAAVLSERAEHSPRLVVAPAPGTPGTGAIDGADGAPGAGVPREDERTAVKGRNGGFCVLVGIGGETGAERIVDATGRLLRFRPARVVLTTVVDHDTAGTADRPATVPATDGATDTDPARRRAREEIDRALRLLKGCAVELARFRTTPPPLVEIAAGRPATALVDLARSEGADVIVVGSPLHRAHPVRGGVCRELLDHSPVPVLVAPAAGPEPRRPAGRGTPEGAGDGRRRVAPGAGGPSTSAAT